jgi:integrase
MGKPELGAHVQKDSASDTNWYIIPLCVKHSIKAEFLEIADTTAFVSAQVGDTCAKQLPIGHVWPHELRETLAANAVKHMADGAKAQDWLDHATAPANRLHGKRQHRHEKPPPLRLVY